MGSTNQYVCGLMVRIASSSHRSYCSYYLLPPLFKPFWSERYSPATLNNLQSCITEGEHIRREIQLAATRCAQLRHQTDQLQRDIEVGLRVPADHAIQGVGVLCGTIEDLYEETKKAVVLQSEEMKKLVKLCKGQAAVVAERFKHLYDESTRMTERGGEVSSIPEWNSSWVLIVGL